jgi:regulator of protease activity HflC (stomatin/prohibitin superfamily)
MISTIMETSAANFFVAAIVTFVGMFIAMPIFFGIARALGLYTVVEERECKVYVLFGKVVAVIDEPGLHLLISHTWP